MTRLATTVAMLAAIGCSTGERLGDSVVPDSGEGAPSRHAVLRADSAAGDSIALATLPQRQREDFILDHLFAAAVRGDSGVARCETLSSRSEPEWRIRMRARDSGNLAVVLFARADRRSGELRRVELARRTADGGQLGYTWDANAGALTALEWAPGQRDPTQYQMPAGTPTPRALRALGRRLLEACSLTGETR